MVDSVVNRHPLPPLAGYVLPSGHRYWQLAILVTAGFVLTVLSHSLTVWQTPIDVGIDQRLVLDFRTGLFQHTQRLSLAFHDARKTGALIGRLNSAASS